MDGKPRRELLVIGLLIVIVAAVGLYLLLGQKGPAPQKEMPAQPPAPPAELPSPAPAPDPQPPAPAPSPPAQTMDKTSGELVNDSVARAESRFYSKSLSGEFSVNYYSWSLAPFNETPDSMPVKQNDLLVSYVRFNDRYIDSLRVFAFSVYVPKGETGPQGIFGSMAFISPSWIDGYAQNGSAFDVRFDPHPEGSQILEGCKIYSSQDFTGASGSDIKIYDFECKVMYGASP